MTQRALGDLVGLSASAVGMYETSRRLPDVDTLYRISAVLGIPADRLCTGLPRPSADLAELVSSLEETLEETDEVTLYGSPLSREARKRFSRAVRGAVRELAAAPEGKSRS